MLAQSHHTPSDRHNKTSASLQALIGVIGVVRKLSIRAVEDNNPCYAQYTSSSCCVKSTFRFYDNLIGC